MPLEDEPTPPGDIEVIESDEDIPVISAEMLHEERVDLEAGIRMFPPITVSLIVACVVVYGRQVAIGGLDNIPRVIETGGMHRSEVFGGQLWRLISYGFMHANGEHVFGNMAMLYVLGIACEHAFGGGPYLFLYLASCVGGALLAMRGDLPLVGASGAIFGLAGALMTMITVHRRKIELRDHRVGIVLAIWSVYTIGLGLLNPIVSNACHLGGLLTGLLMGTALPPAILFDRDAFSRRPASRAEGVIAGLLLVLTALFFLPRLR
jgi:rhomboid protease GluP